MPARAISTQELDELLARLSAALLPTDDVDRIDQLRTLEQVKAAAEARQARIARDLDASQRAVATARGVRAERQGRGIAHQIAAARRVSPHRGRVLLGLARTIHEMPHTKTAFDAGQITEWRVTQLLKETACLTLENRQTIDRVLCSDTSRLTAMGDRQLFNKARALAARLDPKAVAEARANAEKDRRVTLRPAPDTMTYLTALLPVADGVGAYAALKARAQKLLNRGEATSLRQAMADLLVQSVTGRATDEPAPVALGLVMTDSALLRGSDDTAHLDDHGPLPADLARALTAAAIDASTTTWIRRLYTHPTTGELVSMGSQQRLFPAALARFIRLRDQFCRHPWCNSRVKHTDHIRPHADGGATTADNGQGLCEACNHAKQAPGWACRPRPGPGHVVETTTPTGHTYASHALPLIEPSHAPAPVDPHPWLVAPASAGQELVA